MIRGIGIDIVSISAFEKICQDEASQFLSRHFTEAEILYSERAAGGAVLHLAARYAAKESLIKALEGAHLFRPKRLAAVDYREIEVAHDPGGRPYLLFSGAIRELMNEIRCHLSLSHDGDCAIAQVLLEGSD